MGHSLWVVSILGIVVVGLLADVRDTKSEQPDSQKSKKIKLVTKEVSLGKIHPGIFAETWAARSLVVSPDSKRVAYVAQRGVKLLVVVDGEEGKEYDDIGEDTLIFSPDSKRVAYRAQRGEKQLVVVDGVEGKEYDRVYTPIFSPDSKRVAYGAIRGEKQLVVVDGVEGKEYEGVDTPIFSPDSKRVAYGARQSKKWMVVVDGEEGKEYDGFLRGSKLVFDSPKLLHTLTLRGAEFFYVEVEIREE